MKQEGLSYPVSVCKIIISKTMRWEIIKREKIYQPKINFLEIRKFINIRKFILK